MNGKSTILSFIGLVFCFFVHKKTQKLKVRPYHSRVIEPNTKNILRLLEIGEDVKRITIGCKMSVAKFKPTIGI